MSLTIFYNGSLILGLSLIYTNGKEVTHGFPHLPFTKSWVRNIGERVLVARLGAYGTSPTADTTFVTRLRFASQTDIGGVETNPAASGGTEYAIKTIAPGDDRELWELKGFYGCQASDGKGFYSLGIVWGRVKQI
jgi:hypothetical protein